jgi:hypothetical protein
MLPVSDCQLSSAALLGVNRTYSVHGCVFFKDLLSFARHHQLRFAVISMLE